MNIDNYRSKVWRYGKKLKIRLEFEITDNDDEWNDISFIRGKLEHNDWLMKHICTFCPWSYEFNIDLFADSLDETGKNMIEYGHGLNSVKDGRRARYAAHLLRTSYNESMYDDKALDYRRTVANIYWENIDNGMSQMCPQYLTKNVMGMDQEEYSGKMSNVAYKRCREQDDRKWSYCWNYIKKYTRHY